MQGEKKYTHVIVTSRCKMKKTYTHVIVTSRYKMKKTYTHVKLQAPRNQGKASLELIEWTHTLKIGTLSSLKCLKSNITYNAKT